MTAIALKQETDNYWNLIKDAGNEVKLALIKRLSDAVLPAVTQNVRKKNAVKAADFAGMWSDEEYMDADELIRVIYEDRKIESNREKQLEALWDK